MNKHPTLLKLPLWKTLSVLIGFPLLSTILSLLLLHRNIFDIVNLDFFSGFWIVISGWYAAQILIIRQLLYSEGYSLKDIGYKLSLKKTIWVLVGYLLFVTMLIVFIEISLANEQIDAGQLSDFANFAPTQNRQRIIFVIMALVGGLAEGIVYRGFAMRALQGYRIHKILTVFIAALPFVFQHGLKSIDQFWWFFGMGIIFGLIFLVFKNLYLNIILHWLIVLSVMLAVLSTIQ